MPGPYDSHEKSEISEVLEEAYKHLDAARALIVYALDLMGNPREKARWRKVQDGIDQIRKGIAFVLAWADTAPEIKRALETGEVPGRSDHGQWIQHPE
jgi:hypothetical protein